MDNHKALVTSFGVTKQTNKKKYLFQMVYINNPSTNISTTVVFHILNNSSNTVFSYYTTYNYTYITCITQSAVQLIYLQYSQPISMLAKGFSRRQYKCNGAMKERRYILRKPVKISCFGGIPNHVTIKVHWCIYIKHS